MQSAIRPKDPEKVIPPEVLRRWQDMVRRAVAANQPVGPMVQQFAEQAFNRRVGHLNAQAARRRDLVALRRPLAQEVEKVNEVLRAAKGEVLPKPYQGYTFELKVRDDKNNKKTARLQNSPIARASEDHAHKATPFESAFSTKTQLVRYSETLVNQIKVLDEEQVVLDAAVNKGMENRDSLVGELSQMAWALYKVAEAVIASTQPTRIADFLPPENTMTMFHQRPPISMGNEDTTQTSAAAAMTGGTQERTAQQVASVISSGQDNASFLQSAIFKLAADATSAFVERNVAALPLPQAQAKMSEVGRKAGLVAAGWLILTREKAVTASAIAAVVWRNLLRRVFKVLAKPHLP